MNNQLASSSQQFYARLAGLLGLIIIIGAVFAEAYVRGGLVVKGDVTATMANIANNLLLWRLGFVAEIIAFSCEVALVWVLYMLLKPIAPNLALLMTYFRLIMIGLLAVNLLNHFSIGLLLDKSFVFSEQQVTTLVPWLLTIHKFAYLIALSFFSVALFLLGLLFYKSNYIPKIICILVMIAAVGYMFNSFIFYFVPDAPSIVTMILFIPAPLGEWSMALWLLIKGVKS